MAPPVRGRGGGPILIVVPLGSQSVQHLARTSAAVSTVHVLREGRWELPHPLQTVREGLLIEADLDAQAVVLEWSIAVPDLDLNALRRRDPMAFNQRMLILRGGELRVAKEKVREARDSTDRDRAQRSVDSAKSDMAYYQKEIERLRAEAGVDGA